MPRLVFLLAATVAIWGSGCGSCGQSPGEPAPPEQPLPAPPEGPLPAPLPGSRSTPEGKRSSDDESAPLAEVAPPSGRLVKTILGAPAAFWNLPLSRHVVIRGKTANMGAVKRGTPNPHEWPPMTLAVLNRTGGGEPGDYSNKDVDELFQHLVRQRIFTAALPLLVVWNAFAPSGKVQWSIAVPVVEGTQVRPPLTLRNLPTLKVHAERTTPAIGMKTYGPGTTKNKTPADLLRTIVANMRKRLPLTTKPTFVMVRFPEIRDSPNHAESTFEALFAEPVAGEPASTR